MTGPDPGDYLHSGAARAASADVLVTFNIKDFPAQDVGADLRVLHPDDYLAKSWPSTRASACASSAKWPSTVDARP